jgi:hypothetical protein
MFRFDRKTFKVFGSQILFFIGIVTGLTSCMHQSEMILLEQPDENFEIAYPTSWQVEEHGQTLALLDEREFGVFVTADPPDLMDDDLKSSLEGYISSYPIDGIVASQEPVESYEFNGYEAFAGRLVIKNEEISKFAPKEDWRFILTEERGSRVLIVVYKPDVYQEEYAEAIDEVLASFKFD